MLARHSRSLTNPTNMLCRKPLLLGYAPLFSRMNPVSYFPLIANPRKMHSGGQESTSRARSVDVFRPAASEHESQNARTKGRRMNKRLIWVEGDDFTGWCCSHCTWGIIAPYLESTVAALAFNRLAQGTFEKHTCADGNNQDH